MQTHIVQRKVAHWLLCTLVGMAGLGSYVGASTARAAAQPDHPNILWLIAEDLGPHLGCYGTREVWRPNLDQLAERGVRYTRFFTTAPVCSPSRSAFMTGMYQTTIGAHNHRSHRDDGYQLPKGVRLLTEWMREAGYYTANLRELPAEFGFRGSGKTDWNLSVRDGLNKAYYGKQATPADIVIRRIVQNKEAGRLREELKKAAK